MMEYKCCQNFYSGKIYIIIALIIYINNHSPNHQKNQNPENIFISLESREVKQLKNKEFSCIALGEILK